MAADVSPSEVARRLREAPSTLVLLDVREPWERELAVIEPSLHIPMDQIVDRTGELPHDREIIVYCHSGTRSAMVAGYLEHNGFSAVTNLGGGIDAWSISVDPKIPRYG